MSKHTMARVRTITLPHYPDYPIHIALFKNVSNAAFLRSQLLEANPDFDYAFLDATMIISFNHLLAATFLALHNTQTSRLKARTSHSELVFRLHSNNNIGESYRKFGITDDTTALLAIKLGLTSEITHDSVCQHLSEYVKGEAVEIGENGDEVGSFADLAKVKKVYKLDGLGEVKGKKGAVNGDVTPVDILKEMEGVILGTITVKGS
ncbi:kinase binding protein CGI-121-domain-containing protein [Dendryphion nanum]|uniref:EKC/KEOPS complex subunit CGI121 n=1 Tax=Dendryphion nanum TaxID=256645 RepID=A0A9P9DI91_9PLEO|nr:kinase binding protein CGI-121-domain-containing protein [Dendryphion nanum]